MSKKYKERIGGSFTPLLHETMDCPAWKQLSHTAKWLYVLLKRRHMNGRNTAFVSFRDASKELRCSHRKIATLFAELEHYGFIVKVRHGTLGVEGKGLATVWRLTELGTTRQHSPSDVFEPSAKDYLRWNGVSFEPQKTKSRFPRCPRGVDTVVHSGVDDVGSREEAKCGQRRKHKKVA
jgi:Helix-turn-helix domain